MWKGRQSLLSTEQISDYIPATLIRRRENAVNFKNIKTVNGVISYICSQQFDQFVKRNYLYQSTNHPCVVSEKNKAATNNGEEHT